MGNLVWLKINGILIGDIYGLGFNVCVCMSTLKYTKFLEYSSEPLT